MIHVDASQLFRFVRAAKPVTGIQRLTLMSLMGLHQLLGDGGVRALVFDEQRGVFVSASLADFFAAELATFQPAHFGAQDSVLLMEWFWNQRVFEATLEAGRAAGARLFRFMHDVIPVARPDLVRPVLTRSFQANTARALQAADHVLTNSDFSKADLIKHFPAEMAGKPVDVLKLPHEFAIVTAGGQVQRVGREAKIPIAGLRPTIAALAREKFALMVGTLEPRKNSLEVVKAWSGLARIQGADMPKLVVVGFYSAHKLAYTASLIARLRLGHSFVHLDDCTDQELAWLYQHSLFGIYASQYEGWGLPIGESLWFGKPVIAQRVSSMPEVGGALVDYASVKDAGALTAAIEKLAFNADYREKRATEIEMAGLRDWPAFAGSLVQSFRM